MEQKETKRRVVSLLIAVCAMISLVMGKDIILAANMQPVFTPFIEYWIETQYAGNAKLNEIIPIVDGIGETMGYSISFVSKGEPSGYVIIDLEDETDENPIVEFALNGIDPYTGMTEMAEEIYSQINVKAIQKVIRSEYYYNYGVEIQTDDGEKVFTSDNRLEEKSEYDKEAKQRTIEFNEYEKKVLEGSEEVYAKATNSFWTAWVAETSGTVTSMCTIAGAVGFKALDMETMPSHDGDNDSAGDDKEGNCAPTALTTLMKYWDECRSKKDLLIKDSTDDTYVRLAELAEYDPKSGTKTTKAVQAIKKYAKERGYSATVDDYWMNYWSDFTRDLQKGKTVYLDIQGKDWDGKIVGHAAVAFGYRETTDGRYLKVANGWSESSDTYIRFKANGLTAFDGYAVTIK